MQKSVSASQFQGSAAAAADPAALLGNTGNWDSKCNSVTALQGGMQVARPFFLHYTLKLDNYKTLFL